MKFLKKINYYRKPVQWLVVLSLLVMVLRSVFSKEYAADIEAYCPFGGLQSLTSFLVNGTLACSMTTQQIGMGLAIIIAAIIFSKLFCSFVCPLGIFSETIGKYGQKYKLRYTFKGLPDRLLRVLKYAFLFLTFYMTVSYSELFCRKIDPYYAFFSGFNREVNLTYAILAILILTAGAFFIRQAWCKYLCPLGAVTNIFSYTIIIAPVALIYLALVGFTPLAFSWIVLLFIICLTAFMMEAFSMKLFVLPFFKVTRTADTCTSCSKCDKACPMGIKVSEADAVKHIDCHLCGDCVNVCPEKDTLNINRKNKLRWIAPAATVLLFVLSLVWASNYELPTISEFWGSKQDLEKAQIYSREGVKNIKCFGSSMSFATKMRSVDGILGVVTYVKSHRVKVYFNPQKLTQEKVAMLIFAPAQNIIKTPLNFNSDIARWDTKVDRYFDRFDAYYMHSLMEQTKGVYAYKISFGEPAPASFYFDPAIIKPEAMKQAIEQEQIKLFDGEVYYDQKIDFKVKDYSSNYAVIKAFDFYKDLYPPFDYKFNKFETFSEKELDICSTYIDEIPGDTLNQNLTYLMSHLSGNKNIVRLTTAYTPQGLLLKVYYKKDILSPDEVMKWLTSPVFNIQYDDGTSDEMKNVIKYIQVKE